VNYLINADIYFPRVASVLLNTQDGEVPLTVPLTVC
jgi:hypothetical protein